MSSSLSNLIILKIFRLHIFATEPKTSRAKNKIALFVELNGQLRLVQIKQASQKEVTAHPKADPTNPKHIGASMPGMISTVPVKLGQSVKKGDILFTIEAMKMELAIKADQDCVVQEVLMSAGKQVRNTDLVLVIN